jgi:uncharacterized Fe-S cluster protein YjdI
MHADPAAGPPAPDATNPHPPTYSAGATRTYEGEGVRVYWHAERCIHAAACIRALPTAFDPARRPWIALAGADADAVTAAVVRCPTGALHVERTDGGPGEAEAEPDGAVEVRAVRDGPFYVHGAVDVVDEQGRLLRRDTRVALCRCGRSQHLPLCDNSHRATGFRSTPGR